MNFTPRQLISYCFYALLFLVPLVWSSKTSELFEFNKMLTTYAATIIISSLWIARMVVEKRATFNPTLLDLPLVIFLITQTIATILSVDRHTSIFGYYGRFNGGLLSLLAYSILYWAFVSNMDTKSAKTAIKVLLASAAIACVYAAVEHFGISPSCFLLSRQLNTDCWVQDVTHRVFGTFGQPNWLATWLVGITPLAWAFGSANKKTGWKSKETLIALVLSGLFFLTLLFTKSRSGLLGFIVASALFWGISLAKLFVSRSKIKAIFLPFIIHASIFIVLVLTFGSPWTQSFFNPSKELASNKSQTLPALETGGTESGEIRKIVWRGALDIWKNNFLFGTGPETFAYSYYKYRPKEHNLTSEWEFLYNKAHNEYLNVAANTGTIGFVAFALLIIFSILLIVKWPIGNASTKPETNLALIAGYSGILVSNFFGFSVVATNLLFFLFPAFAVVLAQQSGASTVNRLNIIQKMLIVLTLVPTFFLLFLLYRYWRADTLYAQGKVSNNLAEYSRANEELMGAIAINPEALYFDEVAKSSTNLSLDAFETDQEEDATALAHVAIDQAKLAVELSPANTNFKRNLATVYVRLSEIDSSYLSEANQVLQEAFLGAPTDAKLCYNLGLSFARLDNSAGAIKVLEECVSLKPNYRDARFALGLFYADAKKPKEAREQFEYILQNIAPDDALTQQQLEEIR